MLTTSSFPVSRSLSTRRVGLSGILHRHRLHMYSTSAGAGSPSHYHGKVGKLCIKKELLQDSSLLVATGPNWMHNCARSPLGHLRPYHAFCKSHAATLEMHCSLDFPSIVWKTSWRTCISNLSVMFHVCPRLSCTGELRASEFASASCCKPSTTSAVPMPTQPRDASWGYVVVGALQNYIFFQNNFRTWSHHHQWKWKRKNSLKRIIIQVPATSWSSSKARKLLVHLELLMHLDTLILDLRGSVGQNVGKLEENSMATQVQHRCVQHANLNEIKKNLQAPALIAGSSFRIFRRSEDFTIISLQPC